MALSRTSQSGAKGIITGAISSGVSWIESFRIDVAGAEIAGADTSTWQLNLRKDCGGSVDLSASDTEGTLTVTQATTHTLFAIDVPYDALSNLCGDYHADLIEETAAGDRIHWLHGIITVNNDPLWSS